MRSSKQIFQNNFGKEIASAPKMSSELLSTATKMSEFKEEDEIDNKKKENTEATSTASSGAVFGKLEFKETQNPKKEKGSKKIKKVDESIGSTGEYETPAAWAPSTDKKDWIGRSKKMDFVPGSKRVSIKKKCKKFPYCNQGDISALEFYENEKIKTAISEVSKKTGLDSLVIKSLIEYELEKKGYLY